MTNLFQCFTIDIVRYFLRTVEIFLLSWGRDTVGCGAVFVDLEEEPVEVGFPLDHLAFVADGIVEIGDSGGFHTSYGCEVGFCQPDLT